MKFLSIVPMMLLVQGIAAVEAENAKTNLRALKSTKSPKTKAPKKTKGPKATKAPKGPKATKCPKSIRNRSVDAVPLNTDTNYRPELVDADYWHPKSKNFFIIDWERWDANCVVPKVLDPPQRSQLGIKNKRQENDKMIWWHRSKLEFPGEDAWSKSFKPNYAMISDETMDLYSKVLGPNPNSSLIPEPLRNKLWWMEHNDASEALVSFNRYAWRSQTDGNGRPIGLGWLGNDWTNSPNTRGKYMAGFNNYANIQASPDGKWFKIAVIGPDISFLGPPSDPDSRVAWLNIYVVQEGDEFTDREGNVLTYVQPGDILRLTYHKYGFNAYNCDPAEFELMYFPRTVAVLDEETGKITPNCPHYEALIENATRQPPKDLELKTFGFTNATDLTLQERWDFQTSYLSDIQMYRSAATPPHGDDIENL